tara:strand:- start:1991 stop:3679 length:1689 start_codon:yes stop_codon:yes gene_type:complete
MPIDPNIAMGVRPVEQPNVLGQMAQVMAMRQAQQEYENEGGLRNALTGGLPDDPSSLLKYGKQGRAVYESALKGRKEKLESDEKRNVMLGGFAGSVMENPTPEIFNFTLDRAVNYGLMTPAEKQEVMAKYGGSPESIKGYASQIFKSSISAQAQQSDATSRANAATGAAPGHRNATVTEQRFAQEQADRAEADRLLGRPSATPFTPPMTGGGGGGGGGVPNALAPAPTNMLVPGAQAPVTAPVTPAAPAAAPTAAPVTATAPADATAPVDAMNARIQDINAEIARLRPYMGNPKVAANVQQLNTERAQLVTAAKQEAPTLTEVANPYNPMETMRVDARRYKGGGPDAPGVLGIVKTGNLNPAQQLKVKKEMALDFKAVDKTIAETNELLKSIDAVRNSDLEAVAGPFDVLTKTVKSDSLLAETRFASLKGKVTAIAKAASTMTGAIGSIANQEWQILANQIAVLDLKNGKDANLEQIEQLERQAMSIANRMRAGFERQYGEHIDTLGPQYREIPDVTYKMGSEGFTKSGQKRPAKSSATPASTGNIADNAGVAKVIEFGSLK